MMNFAYSKLTNYVPIKRSLKERRDGEFIIVMNGRQELFFLNDTAQFIYNNSDGKKSVEEIFNCLIAEYSIDGESMKEEVKKDVVNQIRDFQWQKLIKLTEVRK